MITKKLLRAQAIQNLLRNLIKHKAELDQIEEFETHETMGDPTFEDMPHDYKLNYLGGPKVIPGVKPNPIKVGFGAHARGSSNLFGINMYSEFFGGFDEIMEFYKLRLDRKIKALEDEFAAL